MITRTLLCQECNKEWQYVRQRPGGRLPKTCAPCRELPDVLRRSSLESKAARKRKAEARVDALVKALRKTSS